MLAYIAERWQFALPWLILATLVGMTPGIILLPSSLPMLLWLHLPVYMIHQIDEHLWPGGFRQFVNRVVFQSLDDHFPVSKAAIAVVNVGLVWPTIGLGAVPGLQWLGLTMLMVTLVNGVLHVLALLVWRRGDPGLVSGALLLIPFSAFALHRAFAQNLLHGKNIAVMVAIALLGHALVATIIAWPWLRRKVLRRPNS